MTNLVEIEALDIRPVIGFSWGAELSVMFVSRSGVCTRALSQGRSSLKLTWILFLIFSVMLGIVSVTRGKAQLYGAGPGSLGQQCFSLKATPQSTQDETRAAAQRALQEAQQLMNSPDTLRPAISKYEEALALYRSIGDRGGKATALSGIAFGYSSIDEKGKALDAYNEALANYTAVDDGRGEAATLNNLGLVYQDIGDEQKALKLYNQSLSVLRAIGDRRGEAAILANLGFFYASLADNSKALEFYSQALEILRTVGDRSAEARTLNNIGRVYGSLGERPRSLEFFNRALGIWRELGDRFGEAAALNNIGFASDSLRATEPSLKAYSEALSIMRALHDPRGEARTLNNLARVYDSLGDKEKALELFNHALSLWKAVGDREGEATTLENISSVYQSLGHKPEASARYTEAAAIRNAIQESARSANKPTLYILSIGIDRYPRGPKIVRPSLRYPLWNLTTAVKDSHDFAAGLARSAGDFKEVKIHPLVNSTKAQILDEFEKVIRDVRSDDTFVFSYSGQGYSAKVGKEGKREFYLMPTDFSAREGARSAISNAMLVVLFTRIQAQRRFLVIDARESSAGFDYLASAIADENRTLAGLLQRDVALVTLSEGPRINLTEGEGEGNGLLTYALLKGLTGEADKDGNGVSVREVIEYAAAYVKRRLPTIPNLDRYQRHVEVKSYFAGNDFPLTKAQSRTALAHRPSESAIISGSNIYRKVSQNQLPQRGAEILGRTDTALSRVPRVRTGKDFALLIAGNTYDQWPQLENPISDAEAIEHELKNNYGFETELIRNPTKAEVVAALKRYKNKRQFATDDQLFIFIAGHGAFIEDFREGYIITRNSLKDDPDASSYLPHSLLRNLIDQIPHAHILLVVDACFGGTFDEWIARNRHDHHYQATEATNRELIDQAMRHQTRLFFTSGGKEYVVDGPVGGHSPFTSKLLEALGSKGENGILTYDDIYARIKRVLPKPVKGSWGENDPQSDFLFITKEIKESATP